MRVYDPWITASRMPLIAFLARAYGILCIRHPGSASLVIP